MDVLARVLIQFIFRLTFGIALAMALTPSRWVTSGFYRVHLWVLMGLNTLAALVAYSLRVSDQPTRWPSLVMAILLAVASYTGAVVWLYERRRVGGGLLYGIGLAALVAAALATPWALKTTSLGISLTVCDVVTGGLLLGTTLTAMFLGHWYLNTPGMNLLPLRWLVTLMALAIVARAVLCGLGLGLQLRYGPEMPTAFWLFVAFRWLAGLLGTATMAVLAWNTLKVPNTQSATGILYAGVILAFLGELVAQLLSVDLLYPV